MRLFIITVSFTLFFISFHNSSLFSQSHSQVQKLLCHDDIDFFIGDFARHVAIDGNVAIASSSRGGKNPINSGMAAVYTFNETSGIWEETQNIVPSDGIKGGGFGESVEIADNFIFVGASGIDHRTGAAYVFTNESSESDQWFEAQKISSDNSYFGRLISVDNGHAIIVGTTAEMYRYNTDNSTWELVKTLDVQVDNITLSIKSVDLIGNEAIIGQSIFIDGIANERVFVLKRNEGGEDNWGIKQIITASDIEEGDRIYYGDEVVLGQHTIVIKATDKLYIYERTTDEENEWQLVKILNNEEFQVDRFPRSFDLHNNILIVTSADDLGRMYVFDKDEGGENNWGLIRQLENNDDSVADFTKDVAFDGETVIAGLLSHIVGGNVFFYDYCDDMNPICSTPERIDPVLNTGFDNFGISVDMWEDHIIVGASEPALFDKANDGYVMIFKKDEAQDTWERIKFIEPDYSENGIEFGHIVQIQENTAVVSATRGREVYIYDKDSGGQDNWGLIKCIKGNFRDYGISVSLNNTQLAVGAERLVHIYEKDEGGVDNWGLVKQLAKPDQDVTNRFGETVALHDDLLIVNAVNKDQILVPGLVYIFSKDEGGENNWGLIKRLESDNGDNDQFGSDVKINDSYAFVGAPFNLEGRDRGRIYIFGKDIGGENNWGKLKDIDGRSPFAIGTTLETNNDFLYSSALNGSPGSLNEYRVHIYDKDEGGEDNWGLIDAVAPSDRYPYFRDQEYGSSIAAFGITIIVGSPSEDQVGDEAGAVYVYEGENVATNSNDLELSDIQLYPNPTSNILFINSSYQIKQCSVLGIDGSFIQDIDMTGLDNFDVSQFKSGVYLLKIQTSDNKNIVAKFMVQDN